MAARAAGRHGPRGRTVAPIAPLLLALAAGAVVSCGRAAGPATHPAADPPASITIFAAASLHDPLAALAEAYGQSHGVQTVIATDSSSALRFQLEQGAEADLFLSADTRNPEALAAAGLVDGEIVPFAWNGLAIVVPDGNRARIVSPFDLARPGIRVVGAGEQVPISIYAAALVDNLASLPGAPPDFAAGYAANVVSREDNVEAVMTRMELGEGDAAIVYASDAARSSSVVRIEVPAAASVVATYAGVVPTSAVQPAAGRAFLAWLSGPEALAILSTFGFSAAP